jgi:hypothetical protein
MHAYHILLPSETDDSRFNSREKHMLKDSVQPYNKPIIDLACSVCTVKYQTSAEFWHGPCSFVHTKKPRSDISQYMQTSRSANNPLLFLRHIILYHHVVTPNKSRSRRQIDDGVFTVFEKSCNKTSIYHEIMACDVMA